VPGIPQEVMPGFFHPPPGKGRQRCAAHDGV